MVVVAPSKRNMEMLVSEKKKMKEVKNVDQMRSLLEIWLSEARKTHSVSVCLCEKVRRGRRERERESEEREVEREGHRERR